jgi:hypothetical protein
VKKETNSLKQIKSWWIIISTDHFYMTNTLQWCRSEQDGLIKKTHQTVEGEFLDWYEKFGGASFEKY